MNPPQVLAVLPGFIPSTFMDVVKPLLRLQQQGKIHFRATVEGLASAADLRQCDLVVFCRNVEPVYLDFLNQVVSKRIPFIYDIDDNFFDIPLDSALGQYHRGPGRMAMHILYLQYASLVRAYSQPLLKRVQAFNPQAVYVRPPLDWDLVLPSRRDPADHVVKIVYPTSRKEDQASQVFLPAVQRLLDAYPGQVQMVFWGWVPEALKDHPAVRYIPPIFDYNRYMNRFSQSGFDIGLAPMLDDPFHRSKTNNKFREYGACGIAGVYSDVPVYAECVCHEETGLLVSNHPDEWYAAIRQLIEDPSAREKIQQQARQYMIAHYDQPQFDAVWLEQIRRVMGQHAAAPAAGAQWQRDLRRVQDIGVDAPPGKTQVEAPEPNFTGPFRHFARLLARLGGLIGRKNFMQVFRQLDRYRLTLLTLLKINLLKKLS